MRIVLGVVFLTKTNLPVVMMLLTLVIPEFGLASLLPNLINSTFQGLLNCLISLLTGWFWWAGCCSVILTNIIGYMFPIMVLKTILTREIQTDSKHLDIYITTFAARANIISTLFKYRALQVYTKVFNSCWEFPFILYFLLGWIVVNIHSLFVLIHYHGKIPILTLLVFASLAVDGFIVIAMLHIFAAPYKLSIQVLHQWSKLGPRRGNKLILRSCSPIKIKIGPVNYFDKFTSLLVLQFCVTGVVNLLVGID